MTLEDSAPPPHHTQYTHNPWRPHPPRLPHPCPARTPGAHGLSGPSSSSSSFTTTTTTTTTSSSSSSSLLFLALPLTPLAWYIFLEFKDRAAAEEAVRQRNNYKLDKQHTFLCNLFTDFEKYDNIPEEFVAPVPEPYKAKQQLLTGVVTPVRISYRSTCSSPTMMR
ncbi:hypothetical protein O3P69_002441 [Scylla paramamosain]|uniref:Uncharacterized protein n=1 Tax=Scylla paramamosain TaxID=85552 RepID=A0AAW0UM96_SCYPA